MVKKFLILFCFCILIFNSSIVYADETGDNSSDSLEGQELLNKINNEMNRSARYDNLISVYSALKTTGFSDYECAAILVNMNRESSITPDACQNPSSWTGGVGLIQWDDRKDALETWSKNNCDELVELSNGHSIGCLACQVAYVLIEFEGGQWSGKAPTAYSINVNEANEAINDSSIDISKKVDLEVWRGMTNTVAMSLYFTSQFERCSYEIDIFNEGAKQSPDMYKLITGSDPATDSNQELNAELAEALYVSGIWGESEFVAFGNLVEEPLVMPDRDSLDQDQLKGVVDWKNNIEYENEGFLIKALRIFVMFFGIIFLVWVILIYLSYWFDRINNFVDIDLLPIITGGRLRVSPEEHECTFNPKTYKKGDAQTVNHKVIIVICLIGIFFSVLVISGAIYTVIGFLVKKMLSVIGVS